MTDASQITLDLVDGEHRSLRGAVGRVTNHARAAADHGNRSMTQLLHVRQGHDAHQVPGVQTGRGRIEALVQGDTAAVEGTPQRVFVRHLGDEAAGTHADRIRQASSDRDEIVRLVNTMPDRDRDRVADVVRSANVLQDRVQSLAIGLADLERNVVAGGASALESEIGRLEDAANPLDGGSEDRVRRLAFLKRQRRSIKDISDRRDAVAAKLERNLDDHQKDGQT